MRFMAKIRMPVESGNDLARAGTLGTKIEAILADQKPEAVYFGLDDGMRTAFLILNLDDPSDLPRIAEPWFLAFNAEMEAQAVMVPADLQKAGPHIAKAVEKFG